MRYQIRCVCGWAMVLVHVVEVVLLSVVVVVCYGLMLLLMSGEL